MKKLLLIVFLFLASCTYNYQLVGKPTLKDVDFCIAQIEFARATHQNALRQGCFNPDWERHWIKTYSKTIKVLKAYRQELINKEVK